jgi:mono/diheme cytochrome c family protein
MARILRGAAELIGLAIALRAGAFAVATDPLPAEQVAFFEQKVRPLLVQHCYDCHSGQAKQVKGGLLLDSPLGWAKGGNSGEPAIRPGKPDESLLLRAVRHTEAGLEMPPEKPKLSEAAIADLATWIKLGAPDPRAEPTVEVKRADKTWWSLQPLTVAAPPGAEGLPESWSSNPIDRFVFTALKGNGLTPNPPADRRVLIRRLSYDLTGLPPTPNEVESFLNDKNPLAYEQLVDRLLYSPRYGERWGRHWLDVVRFGESNGFERNFLIENAWPFRDYVIRSFNADKPFNQFIIEHLAGDLVGKDQPDVEVGVAFLTLGPYDDVGNQDAVAAANIRAATIDDMVAATGAAFLGLTINCARCHHHKFDPVPTEDYYRVKAAFDGVSHAARPLATKEMRQSHQAAVRPLNLEKQRLQENREQIEAAILARAEQAGPAANPRPASSAYRTEETFVPQETRFVRLTMLAHSSNAKSAVDARLDEFEVWTPGPEPRNVALAASGAKAIGVTGRQSQDFVEAYGVELVNDGKYGSRWFVGSPATLTIDLSKPATIERIVFSHDRTAMSDAPIPGLGPALVEYEVHLSANGQQWTKVADSFDRQPFSPALARERKLRQFTEPSEREALADLDRQLAQVEAKLRKIPPLPVVWAGKFAQPQQSTTVFRGGDPTKPGDEVRPASLNVLDQVCKPYELSGDAPEGERRLALARWIASDDNPLTARVLANRVWQHHFGTGLVDTPSDFGFLGGRPTHPELLDWLAHRLPEHGWKLKALHREIVLSQTYQQAGTFRDQAAAIDKYARYLWRFPPRRLTAEELRDTLLFVAGALDLRMGGPGFRLYSYKQDNVSTYTPLDAPGPETYRRAVYHHNARASIVDVLSDYDLPDNAFPAPRRANTTTPLQALTLLNHRFTLDMAAALAERVNRETPGSDLDGKVDHVFKLSFQRRPTSAEREATAKLAASHGLAAVCRALLNANELLFVE